MKHKPLIILGAIFALALGAGLASCSTSFEQLETPQNVTVEKRIMTWDEVEHSTGYIVSINNTEYEVNDNKFELYFLTEGGTYNCEIIALGDGKKYSNSQWAETSATLDEAETKAYDENGFSYTFLEDELGYEFSRGKVKIDDKAITGNVVIPDFFGDYPVIRIAAKSFAFGSLNNPASWYTEENCVKVTTGIQLPAYLRSIGEHAFSDMINLEEITIPDTVTEIGSYAFFGDKNLKHVVLPQGLKEISSHCFCDTALSEINLPEGLETIQECAFYCATAVDSDLLNVVIPNSVTTIGAKAFQGREKLQSFTMSENIQNWDYGVFDDTLWYNSQEDGLVYYNNYLYGYKGEMSENYVLEIPQKAKYIVGGAFLSQSNLIKVTIPNGVKLIGSEIFYNCTSLSEVTLPNDLTYIPTQTFGKTKSLKQITLPNTLSDIGWAAFSNSALESITIPSSVKTIELSAFNNCLSLTSVTLPSSLIEIGVSAFYYCSNLTSVTLPSSLIEIGDMAFALTAIETMIVPASVEQLGTQALGIWRTLTAVYYEGDEETWQALLAQNEYNSELGSATPVYYYSAEQPDQEGNYWHYDADGNPVIW